MAKSNKSDNPGYVILHTVKKVAVPCGRNLEAAPCNTIPTPFAIPAKIMIKVPPIIDCVRNAYGRTKIPAPITVLTVLMTDDAIEAPS